MAVTITQEAVQIIKRSLELAGADPSEMAVRIRVAGGAVRPRFVREPEPTDEVVETAGIRVFVDRSVADAHAQVEIAVSDEHEQLVVRPRA